MNMSTSRRWDKEFLKISESIENIMPRTPEKGLLSHPLCFYETYTELQQKIFNHATKRNKFSIRSFPLN